MSRLVVFSSVASMPSGTTPSPIVDVNADNNLTINGVPTLLIQAAHCSYFFFCSSTTGAGYTEAQAIAKINQLKAAGVNCGESSGSQVIPTLTPPWNTMTDVNVMWQRHGIYNGADGGDITTPPAPEQSFAALQSRMAPYLNQAHTLIWRASGEFDPTSDIPTNTTYLQDHIAQIRQIDPYHLVAYTYGIGANFERYFGSWIGASGLRLPFQEGVLPQTTSVGVILKSYPFLSLMNIGTGYSPADQPNPLNVMSHPEGVGYVPSISITWCAELFEKYQPSRPPSADELDRFFWLQVAMNFRAFNIYNGAALRNASFTAQPSGPSQIYISSSSSLDTQVAYVSGLAADGVTEISETVALSAGTALTASTYSALKFSKPDTFPSLANRWTYRQGGSGGTVLGVTGGSAGSNGICGSGDLGLPIGMLDVWNNIWDRTMTNISSVGNVILAPGNWTQITAVTPAWSPPNFNFTSTSHTTGIYAASKSTGGALYVIAVNMDMQFNSGPNTTTDNAIASGTIDVGQPINTCTRLFEGGSPTFSGSQITNEAFNIAQVHVYKIT